MAFEEIGPQAAGRCRNGTRCYSYHRQELPMLAMFVTIVATELLVVHLWAWQWSPRAAWTLSALTLLVLIHIALLVRAMIARPILVDDRGVTVRCGLSTEIFLPLAALQRLGNGAVPVATAGRAPLRTTVFAAPNVTLQLAEPLPLQRLGLKRLVDCIMLRVDEPDAFRADVEARRETAGAPAD